MSTKTINSPVPDTLPMPTPERREQAKEHPRPIR